MNTILWVVDADWGWKQRANTLKALLPEYSHILYIFNGKTFQEAAEDIAEIGPDIVMCLPLPLVKYLPRHNVVANLTSFRLLDYDYQQRRSERSKSAHLV